MGAFLGITAFPAEVPLGSAFLTQESPRTLDFQSVHLPITIPVSYDAGKDFRAFLQTNCPPQLQGNQELFTSL